MTARQPARQITLRKIERGDTDAVVDVMARAFDDDPLINFLLPQDGKRAARVRRFMHVGLTRMTFPYGETYMAEGLEGAAFWNPPNGRPHGLLSDLSLLGAMLPAVGLRGVPRMMSALSEVDGKHPKEPHFYLLAIGVDPPYQGQGVGTQLMAPILARCDAEGIPAYLESSKERNVPLYERNGFQVVEEMRLPGGGPPLWRMWRDPK
jgi:GNAT superfamily N-acetyltransferase